MAVRLVITLNAAPGCGADLAKAFGERCALVREEPGCEQFEIFQSADNPDKLVLLELWKDQAALDAHTQMNTTRTPLPRHLVGPGGAGREDYEYVKTH